MEKLAAIDIGSNAVRLAIAELDAHGRLTIKRKERVPVRLGTEAFGRKSFSDFTIENVAKTFASLQKILVHEHVTRYLAVATSAYREATNCEELGQAIFKECGLHITPISGEREALLIREAVESKIDLSSKDFLLIDIGGGSMELSLIQRGKVVAAQSFPLGTVRVLEATKNAVDPDLALNQLLNKHRSVIASFFTENLKSMKELRVVGTGGNFRRMLKLKRKLIGQKNADFFSPQELVAMMSELESVPLLKRIKKYNLRADRADVIIPAMKIAMMVLEGLEVKKIFAPDIGLVQGVLFLLAQGRFHEVRDEAPTP
jgi:exopolyphosphatase/guanosine-5'-triphosphate,3'-diphosphate pyrophosphatase